VYFPVDFPEWTSIISLSVLPAVIISACGLLSLAFYGRLAAVVSRLRGFQREILVEQEKLERTGSVEGARLLEVLRTQTEQVKRRARLIRSALMFFLSAVGLLIICSLTLAFTSYVRETALFAAMFFVLGLLSMPGRDYRCADRTAWSARARGIGSAFCLAFAGPLDRRSFTGSALPRSRPESRHR
jgi:Protein of unknown function (DUF2721)